MRLTAGSLIALAAALAVAPIARADRGSIPFVPNIVIYEPNQTAFIAWNGTEEILTVSTVMYAAQKTQVLEFMPYSSEPTIQKADKDFFEKAVKVINAKNVGSIPLQMRGGSRSFGVANPSEPPIEITQYHKIGAHSIWVVRVADADRFSAAIETSLKNQGLKLPAISTEMQAIIKDYVNDGFRFFALDVVDLDTAPSNLDPITYRFQTRRLFYPLRISSTEDVQGGQGKIEIIVLSEKAFPLESFTSISAQQVRPGAELNAMFTRKEIESISPELVSLFPDREDFKLRIWRIYGHPRDFRYKDLIVDPAGGR